MAKRLEVKTNLDKRPAVAKRIRNLRATLNCSQAQLAEKLGVSPGAVNFWEQGKRSLPGPVGKLLDLLEVNLPSKGDFSV